MRCNCMAEVNEKLAVCNTKLAEMGLFNPQRVVPIVATVVLMPRRGARPVTMVPRFCPFCGAAYEGGCAMTDHEISIEELRRRPAAASADPAPVSGDAQDAARYRWLRARDLDTVKEGGVFAGMTPDNVVLAGEDLDHAVDLARLLGRMPG